MPRQGRWHAARGWGHAAGVDGAGVKWAKWPAQKNRCYTYMLLCNINTNFLIFFSELPI